MSSLSLLDTADAEVVTGWLIYKDTDEKRWWNRLLKPGFQHVIFVKKVTIGPQHNDCFWISVDPCRGFTDVDVLCWGGTPPWWRKPNLVAQRISVAVDRNQTRYLFGALTCVGAMKSLLGIRGLLPWTPYQLFKRINERQESP